MAYKIPILKDWIVPSHIGGTGPAFTRRDEALKRATPKWVDLSAISAIQRQARQITRQSGVKHHADHIIPIQGRMVSGLNVPWNLQIIPAWQNQVKSNKVSPL